MATISSLQGVLDGLNPAQQSAVTSPSPVLQILAPPGSGKTRTLTSRVSWLLQEQGYLPWNIICLTFTIKSAGEMKDRIAKQIGQGQESKLILGTFHSVCLRYLRHYGQLIGLKDGFGIADASDTKAIILRIIKSLRLTIDANVARARISKCKARNEGWRQVQQTRKKGVDQQAFQLIYEAYQNHLEASNILDYDDLLMLCVQLLSNHPECVSNIEVVLIDEFQDTNNVQFMLMTLFAQRQKKITTVGDPDQSIYGWRSAEIKNLVRMRDLYPETHVVHLEDNYRSSRAILQAAQEVIEQDSSRPQKSLQATHGRGTTPVLRMLYTSEAEAQWIVAEIKRCMSLTGNKLLSFSDFAILIRSAAQSRLLEIAMGKAAVPYRMVGGTRFFDRVEIKLLLDYLRIISHPGNSDATARVLNEPPRGVGKDTIKELLNESTATATPLWDLIKDTVQNVQHCSTKLSKQAEQGLERVFNIIESCKKKLTGMITTRELLEQVIKRTEFKKYIEKKYPEDTEGVRWANVEELLAQASDVDQFGVTDKENADALPQISDVEQRKPSNPSEEALSNFLANVALATELRPEEGVDLEGRPRSSVTLCTMHAAKGLEWPVVFVPSVYHGSLPHSRAEDNDEERRLLYVAMTRAQALLYLSCPTRNTNSDETVLSPFLDTKEVRSCLECQGPSIHADVVFDICKILRREQPSYDELVEAETKAEILEDDEFRWPLDGSAGQEASSFSNNRSAQCTGHSESMRLQFHYTHGTSCTGAVTSDRREGNLQLPSPSFGAGFTSAAVVHTMQQKSGVDAVVKSTSMEVIETRRVVTSTSASRKMKGQHTLSTWLSGSQSMQPPSTSTMKDIPRMPRSSHDKVRSEKNSTLVNTENSTSYWQDLKQRASQITNRNDQAVGTRVRLASSTTSNMHVPGEVNAISQPNKDIPREFKTHSIQLSKGFKRSHTEPGTSTSRKRGVYTPLSAVTQQPARDLFVRNDSKLLEEIQVEETTGFGFRPASSCHTTTMTTLQEPKSVQRKILGLRRNIQGWSAKGPQSFKVPHLSGAGSAP